ncbi:hypothetical protein JZ751_007921 [Albula glossodonta]|uniref:G-protein coupled receptors family 1 profile domain-containing protein n=1 Tax=Albula glossodonta TaxID=121402 RepID=A0A8T2NYE8_9TELE|nr:hypothetical protein JZ751_007921 [Albula glossodonta]
MTESPVGSEALSQMEHDNVTNETSPGGPPYRMEISIPLTIAKKRTRTPPGRRKKAEADKKHNGLEEEEHFHEKLRGDKDGEDKEGVGKGEINGVEIEESSSSDHKVNTPCSMKKNKAKGKTKLSRIKPGDNIPKREDRLSVKGSRWKGRQNREKRFTFVLAVVIGVFMICWFPFFFTYTLTAICDSCNVPQTLFKFFFWFGYCNSSLNPMIYTIFNNDFRRAFKKILCKVEKKQIV